MSTRHLFALIVTFCTLGQLGCCSMMKNGGGGCGMGGQAYSRGCPSCGVADASCGCPSGGFADASCGMADASCGCADVSCGCPDASCGCPTGGGPGCGGGVRSTSGASAFGGGRLLSRMRKALNGYSGGGCSSGGCGGTPYYNEWQDSPPSQCESCDQYGNYTGGPYGSPHGRRAQMARRNINFNEELRSGEESGPIYR